jgi:hypothetical protein
MPSCSQPPQEQPGVDSVEGSTLTKLLWHDNHSDATIRSVTQWQGEHSGPEAAAMPPLPREFQKRFGSGIAPGFSAAVGWQAGTSQRDTSAASATHGKSSVQPSAVPQGLSPSGPADLAAASPGMDGSAGDAVANGSVPIGPFSGLPDSIQLLQLESSLSSGRSVGPASARGGPYPPCPPPPPQSGAQEEQEQADIPMSTTAGYGTLQQTAAATCSNPELSSEVSATGTPAPGHLPTPGTCAEAQAAHASPSFPLSITVCASPDARHLSEQPDSYALERLTATTRSGSLTLSPQGSSVCSSQSETHKPSQYLWQDTLCMPVQLPAYALDVANLASSSLKPVNVTVRQATAASCQAEACVAVVPASSHAACPAAPSGALPSHASDVKQWIEATGAGHDTIMATGADHGTIVPVPHISAPKCTAPLPQGGMLDAAACKDDNLQVGVVTRNWSEVATVVGTEYEVAARPRKPGDSDALQASDTLHVTTTSTSACLHPRVSAQPTGVVGMALPATWEVVRGAPDACTSAADAAAEFVASEIKAVTAFTTRLPCRGGQGGPALMRTRQLSPREADGNHSAIATADGQPHGSKSGRRQTGGPPSAASNTPTHSRPGELRRSLPGAQCAAWSSAFSTPPSRKASSDRHTGTASRDELNSCESDIEKAADAILSPFSIPGHSRAGRMHNPSTSERAHLLSQPPCEQSELMRCGRRCKTTQSAPHVELHTTDLSPWARLPASTMAAVAARPDHAAPVVTRSASEGRLGITGCGPLPLDLLELLASGSAVQLESQGAAIGTEVNIDKVAEDRVCVCGGAHSQPGPPYNETPAPACTMPADTGIVPDSTPAARQAAAADAGLFSEGSIQPTAAFEDFLPATARARPQAAATYIAAVALLDSGSATVEQRRPSTPAISGPSQSGRAHGVTSTTEVQTSELVPPSEQQLLLTHADTSSERLCLGTCMQSHLSASMRDSSPGSEQRQRPDQSVLRHGQWDRAVLVTSGVVNAPDQHIGECYSSGSVRSVADAAHPGGGLGNLTRDGIKFGSMASERGDRTQAEGMPCSDPCSKGIRAEVTEKGGRAIDASHLLPVFRPSAPLRTSQGTSTAQMAPVGALAPARSSFRLHLPSAGLLSDTCSIVCSSSQRTQAACASASIAPLEDQNARIAKASVASAADAEEDGDAVRRRAQRAVHDRDLSKRLSLPSGPSTSQQITGKPNKTCSSDGHPRSWLGVTQLLPAFAPEGMCSAIGLGVFYKSSA